MSDNFLSVVRSWHNFVTACSSLACNLEIWEEQDQSASCESLGSPWQFDAEHVFWSYMLGIVNSASNFKDLLWAHFARKFDNTNRACQGILEQLDCCNEGIHCVRTWRTKLDVTGTSCASFVFLPHLDEWKNWLGSSTFDWHWFGVWNRAYDSSRAAFRVRSKLQRVYLWWREMLPCRPEWKYSSSPLCICPASSTSSSTR